MTKLIPNELLDHLSPPFLMLDDAARYATANIDRRQSKAMGGYVLIGAEGHLYATHAFAGALSDLVFKRPIDQDVVWQNLMLQGYRPMAYYFCDIDRHAQLQRLRPAWSAQRIALTLSLPDAQAVAATGQGIPAFYTVGPQGSLVRFLRDENLKPGAAQPLPPQSQAVEQYVYDLMREGELSVVITSPVWAGWRGELAQRWKAYLPDPLPLNVDPYFSPIYPDAPAAMAFAHRRMLRKPQASQMGFLLKHQTLPYFLVTEPVEVQEPVFDPLRVFRTDTDGTFFHPPAFLLAGIYWLVIDASAPPRVKEPWLYERFITPNVLAHGINAARVFPSPDFALFVSTADGAQLRYGFSASAAESALYNAKHAPGRSIDNGKQAELDEGRISSLDWVQQVAAAGELSVTQTSALWDVAGRVDAHWMPYSQHPQRPFSPTFVLADDAARHAHELIGGRREREYIGLILKDQQQRFVATQPLENPGERFDWHPVGLVDRDGLPVVIAAGFSLHGIYSSRGVASPVGRTWEGDEARVAAQMFTDTDIHRILTFGPRLPVTYLSGSADSLIAFQAFAPDIARELLDQTAPATGGSQLYRQLQDETLVPSDVVRGMVLVGVLRVVVGSRIWGSPGKIESDWSPPFQLSSSTVPDQPRLGPIFASAREAVVDASERRRRAYAPDARGLGLVLKSRTAVVYVATQTVPGEVLDRLCFTSAFGAPVLTETFVLHSVYYCASGLPAGLRGQAAWRGRHFIGAQDLYAALYDQQGRQRGLTLHLSVLDGGLLEFRGAEDPVRLFVDESGTVDPHVLPAKLAQTLTSHGYVLQLALAGQLSVLSPSDCWDVAGRVGADWRGFSQVNRHPLGPAFISADDAARHAQLRLGARRDKVYGGLILRRTDDLYTATEPVAVYVENFAPGWVRRDELVVQSQFLGGSTAVARYHSQLAGELPFALNDKERALYRNMFASDFLGAMLDESPAALRFSTGLEYLFCEDGAVLSVARSGGALERSLADKLAARRQTHPKNNELEQALRDGILKPAEYVNRVARALVLRVVKGSSLWGRAARVEQWQRAMPAAVTVDIPISPVFVQLPDALRHVHHLAGPRRQLTFGAVFKARHAQRYVASVPQAAGTERLGLDRLLVDGVPPIGFELLGLYLCPPAQAAILPDDPLYRYFVAPTDLDQVWGLRGPARRDYLPAFLGVVDGAWLKLAPRSTGPFGLGIPTGNHTLAQLQSAALKPLAYVRKTAAAVEMSVLVTSSVWSAPGPVNADWEPRRIVQNPAPALAFGPLFSHPDDAARHARRRLGRVQGEEYLGLVLVNATGTSFVAAEPLRDAGIDSPVPQSLFLYESTLLFPSPPVPAYPSGFKLLAAHLFFSTIVASSDDSPADKRLGEHFVSRDALGFYRNLLQVSGVRGAFCYLSTRQGALLKYAPAFTGREEQLFSGLMFGPSHYRPTEWLSRLASDGVLQVLDADDYWRKRGVVVVDWMRSEGEETPHLHVQSLPSGKDEL